MKHIAHDARPEEAKTPPRGLLARLAAWLGALALVLLAPAALAQEAAPFYLDLDTGGHRAFVKDLAFTADGEYLVSASDDKTIRIWDWKSGLSLRTLRGQVGDGNEGKVFAVAVSPDGKTVAAGGYFGAGLGDKPPYGDVRLFDFSTGRIKAVLKGAEYAVYDLAFSPDDQRVAAGGQDGYVYVWRQDSASETGWTADVRLDADSYRISQLGFALGGARMAVATADNGIRLWDMQTRDEIALPAAADALRNVSVTALAVSSDGKSFATGTVDGQVAVWDAAGGALLHVLPKQDFAVGALSFAGAGTHLVVSCGYRCTDKYRTQVWRIDGAVPVTDYTDHDGTVLASAATPDGLLVATAGGQRHAIHVWDPLTGKTAQVLQGRGKPVTAVGFEPKTMTIAWGTENPCPQQVACPETLGALASQLQLPSEERYFETPGPLGAPAGAFRRAELSMAGWSLKATPGGRDKLDNAILDIIRDGTVVHRIENDATNGFMHSAFTLFDQGQRLVTGGSDGTLIEYASESGAFAGEFKGGHTGEVQAVVALDREGLLLTGSADQTLRLWNLRTRELILSFYFEDTDWVAWMPQGYYYASDNGDDRFGWHVNQGQGKESRFVRAGQLKTFLWSPEMVRRAIILKSAKAAVAEMRPGAERELERLLQRKPPEFDAKLAGDQSGVRPGYAAVEIVGAREAETRVSDFTILSNDRNVGDLAARSVSGDEKTTIIEVPVEDGENVIRITGANAEGYVTERSIKVLGTGRPEVARKGKLFVAVIGVEKYPFLPDACRGLSCDLRYSVDDATAFLDILARKSAPLFASMETLVLVNRDALDGTPGAVSAASLDAILEPDADTIGDELKDFLARPGPDDTTIVFVAGHGINIGEDYFFIPTDGRKQDADKWKPSSLVEWSDIQKAVERAEGVRFMVLDTCHAANAFNPRLAKDAADARIIVFSATAANNTALERADLGHGVFTYSMLQGLGGKAKTSVAGVTLFGLADYVALEVATLTASKQKPFYYVGGAENLLLAQP